MTDQTWNEIEADYFAAHKVAKERGTSSQASETVTDGAVLLRRIVEVIDEVNESRGGSVVVSEAAVRYLLNRDFSYPEGMVESGEIGADMERSDLSERGQPDDLDWAGRIARDAKKAFGL
jgi:hypothetical protein